MCILKQDVGWVRLQCTPAHTKPRWKGHTILHTGLTPAGMYENWVWEWVKWRNLGNSPGRSKLTDHMIQAWRSGKLGKVAPTGG